MIQNNLSNVLTISLTLVKYSKIDYNQAQPHLTAVFDGFYVQKIKVQWGGWVFIINIWSIQPIQQHYTMRYSYTQKKQNSFNNYLTLNAYVQ